ncbi:uncharacterized protein LOC119401916 isoform X6 [Rhipicephalus sanguineus]|uniref:uncharacterized protein LOC119401916 isoform X6 n=1 Tax=Rhipicephalus sanguineus TaxID=34632 RepID=UPI0018950184|nr:uncharacterized protein LOC119401916 isoform X6 [Rhipicephalus sanguineus]
MVRPKKQLSPEEEAARQEKRREAARLAAQQRRADPEYRAKQAGAKRQRRAEDPEFRSREVASRLRYDRAHREQIRLAAQRRRGSNPGLRVLENLRRRVATAGPDERLQQTHHSAKSATASTRESNVSDEGGVSIATTRPTDICSKRADSASEMLVVPATYYLCMGHHGFLKGIRAVELPQYRTVNQVGSESANLRTAARAQSQTKKLGQRPCCRQDGAWTSRSGHQESPTKICASPPKHRLFPSGSTGGPKPPILIYRTLLKSLESIKYHLHKGHYGLPTRALELPHRRAVKKTGFDSLHRAVAAGRRTLQLCLDKPDISEHFGLLLSGQSIGKASPGLKRQGGSPSLAPIV